MDIFHKNEVYNGKSYIKRCIKDTLEVIFICYTLNNYEYLLCGTRPKLTYVLKIVWTNGLDNLADLDQPPTGTSLWI